MKLTSLALALCISAVACARPDANAETHSAAPTAATNTSAVPTPATPTAADTSLVRADKARIIGSESAKVWLIMSSDFQCPYCRAFHDETWGQIYRDYVQPGKVRVAFLNHPMPFHPFAIPAAEAAMCAAKQDKFWQMHDSLFANQEAWVRSGNPQPIFDRLATGLGIRMDDWRSCVSSHATRGMIEADFERSKNGGVKGTPSFFIGGRLAIEGAAPYASFRAVLDSTLKAAGGR